MRRECEDLLQTGRAAVEGGEKVPRSGTRYSVDGQKWLSAEHLLIALNKPSGYECSARPSHYPGVLELFSEHYRRRGLQPVGRLDQDTTGLLLLTDNGELNHRLTSPKHHVPKTYLVTLAESVDERFCEKLRTGVELHGDGFVKADSALLLSPLQTEVVIRQGLYHQVKRMIAAAGNRCTQLVRTALGPWNLEELGLAEGEWKVLNNYFYTISFS